MKSSLLLATAITFAFPGPSYAQEKNLTDPHDYRNAQAACDDAGLAAGDKRMTATCHKFMADGLAKLQAAQQDPVVSPIIWEACHNRSEADFGTNFGVWAMCVTKMTVSCPAATLKGDDMVRRCLRAVQSDGWAASITSRK